MLYFIGDTHGNWTEFKDVLVTNNVFDANIVHLGDAGFGFHPRRVDADFVIDVDNFLRQRNCTLYNVRGNHDNPYWFMAKEKFIKHLQDVDKKVPPYKKTDYHYIRYYINPKEFADMIFNFNNVKFVKDYDVINLDGFNVLFIGGGISIDRIMRDERTYYRNENVTYNNKINKLRDINIVATHIAPYGVQPFFIGGNVEVFTKTDATLKDALYAERQLMTKIFNDLIVNNKPTKWFYAHYHMYYNQYIDDTNFICLKPNQILAVR